MRRKKKSDATPDESREMPAIDATLAEEDSPQPGEGISLSIVDADDLSPGEKPKKRKLKDSLASIFVSEEDEPESKTKTKKRKASRFFQKNCSIVAGVCMFLAALIAPSDWSQPFTDGDSTFTLLPTEEHWTAILQPLARIADRHSSIVDLNPDVLDAFASLNAMVAYGFELRSLIILKAYLEKDKKEEKPAQPLSFDEYRRINGLHEQY